MPLSPTTMTTVDGCGDSETPDRNATIGSMRRQDSSNTSRARYSGTVFEAASVSKPVFACAV